MRHFIFLLMMFFVSQALAQTKQVLFDRISVDEGLPEGNVVDFLQDSSGYMWVASYEGLYLHDGNKLSPVNQGANNTSLTTTRISNLDLDYNGDIWVGTYTGLNRIDSKTGVITQYLNIGAKKPLPGNRIFDIYTDSDNTVWINTDKGPARYNRSTDSFEAFKIPFETFVYCFYEVGGRLLLGTGKGLYAIDKQSLFSVPVLDSTAQRAVGKVVNIYKDDAAEILLCTTKGLWKYNDNKTTISRPEFMSEEYGDIYVKHIVQDVKGNYWISTYDNLIHIYTNANKVEVLNKDNSSSKSILSKVIHVFFEDNSGNIWIGTDLGVNKINVLSNNFKFYQLFPKLERNDYKNHIQRIHQLPDGSMFYYTYRYLYYAKEVGDTFTIVNNAPPVFVDNIYTMPNGEVWLCYTVPASGVWRYIPATRSLEQVHISKEVDNASIYELDVDIDSPWIYWIAGDNGMTKYNSRTKKAKLLNFKSSVSRPYPNIKRFLQSKSGYIYMSAGSVLIAYDKRSGKLIEHPEKGNRSNNLYGIRDLLQTSDGIIWIACETGLAKYNEVTGELKLYTTQNGLRGGDIIYTFLLDDNDKIWMTTFNHIICLDPITEKFSYYSQSDGVNTSFNRWSSCKLNDGSLAFGGTNGLVLFHPDSIKYSSHKPNVVINAIKVNSLPYESEIIPERQKQVNISYADKVVSFEFKALEYTDVTRNDYAYKLEGFNDDWVYSGNENKATYTNLEPGEYTFSVKATNYNGVWNDNVASIQLIVAPMFWQEWWFRLIVLILVVALAYYIWKSNREKNSFKQQKEIAEQNDHYKTQFLSNVSHEIRTPLNAIIGLNKLLLDTPLTTQQHKYVHAAAQSSESLFTLINDLLDQAKIESGKFKFVERPFKPREVIQQVHDTFLHKASEKRLTLNLSIANDLPNTLLGDAVRLHQVLSNLVSNAIKFTDEGSVNIKTSATILNEHRVQVCFIVEDTGIGMEVEKLDKIFDSFHQLDHDAAQNNIGTGLGLSICKQLVEQQGGNITVESTRGKGSVFTCCIPYTMSEDQVKPAEVSNRPFVKLSGLKILLVEDTPFNQLLAVEILKKNIDSVTVLVAENGKEALDLLETHKDFDIILMDVKMPVMNGYETSEAIRAQKERYYKTVPIIAFTANAVPEQLDKCRQAGMNDWITKPVDDKLLIQKIAHLTQTLNNDEPR